MIERAKSPKDLLARLEEQREVMRQHATVLPPEQRDERVRKARQDPFYFFETYFPHYCQDDFAEFHEELLDEANKPGINALAAPRGFGKSALVTTMETARRVVFGITPFQIIVKETKESARDEVAFIQLELEDNPRIIADFGLMKRHGDWEEGDFVSTTNCRVLSLGIGQTLRGKRYRQYRPARIVIDDPEKDKHVKNPRLVKEQVEWFFDAAFPALDPSEESILTWLGTLISKRSALALCMKRKGVNKRIWSAWKNTKKGLKSLFPSRFTVARLKQIKQLVGSRTWRKEYMNDPSDDPNSTFQEKMIHRYNEAEVDPEKIVFIAVACDPSLNSDAASDYKAIIPIRVLSEFRGMKGPWYLIKSPWVRQATLEEMFAAFFERFRRFAPTAMGLEIHAWQRLLKKDITRWEQKEGVRLPIYGLKAKVNKEARITRLQPLLERGVLLFEETDDPDVEELVEQFLGFDEPSVPDDGPDATEMTMCLCERRTSGAGRVEVW
ncbi:hypothetical protein KDL45_16005 [bacterium]|nr:hypothetical protein [bacterium]